MGQKVNPEHSRGRNIWGPSSAEELEDADESEGEEDLPLPVPVRRFSWAENCMKHPILGLSEELDGKLPIKQVYLKI